MYCTLVLRYASTYDDPSRSLAHRCERSEKAVESACVFAFAFCSSALIFYIDWDFSLGHMSMDLSSVLAALSSHGLPSVTRTNIQVASPQGCTPGLAGPEPSGTFIHPGCS